MKDEELLEWKGRLCARLLRRMNRHFYPLACESFTGGKPFEKVFAERAGDLPAAARGAAARKYVHFRLFLADMFLRSSAEGSPFLALTLMKGLSLDVTGQMAGSFKQVRDGLLHFYFSSESSEDGAEALVSLLEKEIGSPLSPLVSFFREETEGFLSRMKADASDFLAALAFCDPDFHEPPEKLPRFLSDALAEEVGLAYSDQVWESAQMMATLDKAARDLISIASPQAACFLYRYALFRMEVFAFFASYLWQDRRMKSRFFRGCLGGRNFTRWVKRMQMRGFLSEGDLFFSGRLYLKMHMFMRQWVFFNPKERKYFYKYFPNFTTSITDRTDEATFDQRVWALLEELRRSVKGEEISAPFLHFLVQETRTYVVNMAHTVYFAYTMGLKRPEDFVARKYRRDDAPSLWNQMKGFFRRGRK